MEVASGNGQSMTAGATLADSIVVRIVHVDGTTGGGGHAVEWTVVLGGGSVASAMTWTDLDGITRNAWTLGPEGPQSVRAKSGGMEVTFIATATDPPAASGQAEER